MVVPVFIIFFLTSWLSLLTNLSNKFEKNILVLSIYSLCVVIAVYRPYEMPDYAVYYNAFIHYKLERAEIGYLTLMHTIRSFSENFHLLLFIMASISVAIKIAAIKRFSNYILLSLSVYISNIYILHDMIQMRAAIASGLLLFSIYYIYNNNFFYFLFTIFIGTLFHQSMLAMLPLWALNSVHLERKYWLAIIPLAYCITISGMTVGHFISLIPVPSIQNSYHQYQQLMDAGLFTKINIFNTLILLRVTICLLLIYKIDTIKKYNKLAIIWVKIYTLAITVYLVFSDIPVLATRLSELFFIVEILLFPLIVYVFSKRELIFGKLSVITVSFLMLLINTFYIHILL